MPGFNRDQSTSKGSGIVNRCPRSRIRCIKSQRSTARNCRNLLVPSRVRREVMAENLDKLWLELRRHAAVETDPQKLWQLAAELERRKQVEVSST
jgi:hypothetical protein